jgi:hypothetical protein
MLAAFFKKVILLSMVGILLGCFSMVTFQDMGQVLDQEIGNPLPKLDHPIEWYYVRREVDSETYELVSRRPDQCNYILTIRAADHVILKWRYLSATPPTTCHFQHVGQLM